MSYIIDFSSRLVELNYLLRLRGTPSGVVDIANNTNITNYNIDYTSTSSILGEGTALKFNGTSSYFNFNLSESLLKSKDFTISMHRRNRDNTRSDQNFSYFVGNDGYTNYNDITNLAKFPSFSIESWQDRGGDTTNKIFLYSLLRNSSGTYDPVSYRNLEFSGLNTMQNYHLAIVNKDGIIRVAVNGKFSPNTVVFSSNTIHRYDNTITVGYEPTTGAVYKFSKFTLEDYCVIQGTALWTSSFKPPTKYLPDKWPVYD